MTRRATEDAGIYSYVLAEQENLSLATEQVREINNGLRKVRSLARDSQRLRKLTPGQLTLASTPRADDTGQYCIPEPSSKTSISSIISRALDLLESDRREAACNSVASPVVKKWTIL